MKILHRRNQNLCVFILFVPYYLTFPERIVDCFGLASIPYSRGNLKMLFNFSFSHLISQWFCAPFRVNDTTTIRTRKSEAGSCRPTWLLIRLQPHWVRLRYIKSNSWKERAKYSKIRSDCQLFLCNSSQAILTLGALLITIVSVVISGAQSIKVQTSLLNTRAYLNCLAKCSLLK